MPDPTCPHRSPRGFFAMKRWLVMLPALLLLGAISPLALAYNADLKINALSINDNTPDEGQVVQIQIQVKNNGSAISPVPGVYVDAPLPAGLTGKGAGGSTSSGAHANKSQ